MTGSQITVLHVDDDPDVLERTAAVIERDVDWLETVTARGSGDGLAILSERDVDCILSAYDLSETDGVKFCENVRETHSELPFVLYTDEGSEDIASDAVSAGVTGYAGRKPDSEQATDLATRVRNAVDRAGAKHEPEGSHTELGAIAENTSDAIVTIDAESTIQFANAAVEDLFGYAPADLEGESLTTVMPPRYRDAHLAAVDRYLETGEPTIDWHAVEFDGQHRDGHELPLSISFGEFERDGERRFVGVIRDISRRLSMEEELQAREDRFQQLVDEVTEYAIFMLDTEGHIVTWNAGAERIKGYTEDEILTQHYSVLYPDEAVAAGKPDRLLARAGEHGSVTDEGWRVRKDGTRFWANVTITALHDDAGDLRGFTKVTRDMTERKRREDRLAGLSTMLADFFDAEDTQAVCDIAIDAAESGLHLPVTMIARFADGQGSLRPAARTSAAREQLDEEQLLAHDGAAWETFTTGAHTVLDISSTDQRPVAAPDAVDRLAVYSLGSHGVFLTALPADDITDPEDDFLQTVLVDIEAALDRIEREEVLQDREAILAQRTEDLEQLTRINDIIRTIDRALVAATSRDEIERMVCNELVNGGPYVFAWLGEYDVATNAVEPRAHAGTAAGYLDAISVTVDDDAPGQNPTAAAVRTRSPQVVERISTDPPYEPWRKAALSRGYRAVVALPITYRDRLYGVLTLFADDPDYVGDLERTVLAELATNVGQAICAIETQRALVSDAVVELAVRVPVTEIPLVADLPQRAEAEFDIEMLVPAREGMYRVGVAARNVPADVVIEALDQAPFAQDGTLVGDRGDASRIECLVTDESLIAWLLAHGATPQSIAVTDDDARLTVHLPNADAVRPFVESFQSRYAGAELIARRERDRAVRTRHDVTAELEERLTPRQREILRVAYARGYFESPREHTASELAASLDISQPAFTNHLRASERKLLDLLYGDAEPG